MLAMPLTPVVLVAGFMTVLIIPAIFGLPLLALAGRPWWVGLAVGTGRKVPDQLTPGAQAHIVVCVAVLASSVLVAAVLGFNDLDSVEDALVWLVLVAMLISGTVGGLGLVQSARAGRVVG